MRGDRSRRVGAMWPTLDVINGEDGFKEAAARRFSRTKEQRWMARADARAGEIAILRERWAEVSSGGPSKTAGARKNLIAGRCGVLRRWCPEDRMKSS